MKVYKNPFVSRESYFVKTGAGHSYKMEASKSKGYIVEFIGGKWEVREGCYYDFSLKNELTVIAENKVSIKSVIDRAVINAVLDLVGETKMEVKEDGNNHCDNSTRTFRQYQKRKEII